MGRKQTRKTRSLKVIKTYVKKGYGSNEIIRRLKKRNLGLRRKKVLEEIRLIKKQELELAKRQKYIPKKYRKRIAPPPPIKIKNIYRMCVIMNNIPVSSRPFNRNYLGMRVCAFSINEQFLNMNLDNLKQVLLREIEQYIGYKRGVWWWDAEIGIEFPTEIQLHNAQALNGRWIFRVEKDGVEKYERNGIL